MATWLLSSVPCHGSEREYVITPRPDGGYSLTIVYERRQWSVLHPEGILPKIRKVFVIDIVGKGKD